MLTRFKVHRWLKAILHELLGATCSVEITTYRQYVDVSIQSVNIIILLILVIADACRFIDAKQHEPTHLHTLLQRCAVTDIAWLVT